jgi:hypothetical protein
LKRVFCIIFILFCYKGYAQQVIETVNKDSVALANQLQFIASVQQKQSTAPVQLDTMIYRRHPYFHFTHPARFIISERQWNGKETIFYSVMTLLIFFALIKNGFSRYITELFQLFFRTTLKQRQIKEQMMQTPMPSLFLNILFVLSAGLFITLLLTHFKLAPDVSFWQLLLYTFACLAGIYIIKLITLKILGWLFRLSDGINSYIFIVFTTNKIIGIVLLPFLILLGFSTGTLYESALSLSFLIIGGCFAYRFYLSYVSIHNQVKINFFHFILYLAAFEVAPLLLINKLLFRFLS